MSFLINEVRLVLLCLCVVTCLCFNVEDRMPIIKRGAPGSLFGLSVAEHHITRGSTSPSNAVLLVGAPTAEAEAYHSPDSQKPGALFKCEVSSNPDDCQSIQIDDAVNTVEVNNSNQWLGVTVKEERPGGRVAVCAHRFTIRGGGTRHGVIWEAEVGRCYMLDTNLVPVKNFRSQWTPCVGKLSPDGSYSTDYFGYCQAGSSIEFANNTEKDVVFGTPGIFTWTGGIKSSEFAPHLFFPAQLWSEKETLKPSVPSNSYLGFSLTSGYLVGSNINFVSGAPRGNDTGMVVIFEKATADVGKYLSIKEVLLGEVLASSFGYDVKVIDITGDNRQDLIVSAPQYYDHKKKIGGAVYIYVNKGLDKIGPNPTTVLYGEVDSSFGNSITNLGDINMDGANDIAIGAPGADGGYGEVHIFHGNSDPSVGIYNTPTQIIKASSLYATRMLNVTGFGYSLSGGLDMDFNGYPDIAVGSLSDVVVMYRVRPIVNVKARINASVAKVTIDPELSDSTVDFVSPSTGKQYKLVTFDISVCMNYSSSPNSFDDPVNMTFTVKLDVSRLNEHLRPRATFSPLDYEQGIKTDTLLLYPQSTGLTKCTTMPVYLAHDMQDKLSPFEMSLTFDVTDKNVTIETPDSGLVSVNQYPIFNKEVVNTTSTQVNISKACGPDDVCRSQLQMVAHYVVLLDGDSSWSPLSRGTDGLPVLFVGTEKAIGIRVDVSNSHPGEDAHQAKLKIAMPTYLRYVGLTDKEATGATVSCDTQSGNASFVVCDLGNPFRTNSLLSMTVKLENDGHLYDVNQFTLFLEVSTSSTQEGLGVVSYSANVRVQAQMHIEGYSDNDQLQFSGEVIGESVIKTPSDAGLYVTHGYEIENTGTTVVDGVYVNISWPYEINNGKWLFYLLEADVYGPGKTNDTKCNIPEDFVNPLKLTYDKKSSAVSSELKLGRNKRELDSPDGSPENVPADQTAPSIKPASSHKQLICDETAHCVHFTCSLSTMLPQKKVYIDLKAVVWNSTFLEEYNGVAEVRIFSSAHVGVIRENVLYSPSSVLDAEVSTSMLSETVVQPEQEVKLWIIAVATLAGVILLVIIVLVLWKCGFFKRRRDFGDYHKARRHRQASKKADEMSDRMLY